MSELPTEPAFLKVFRSALNRLIAEPGGEGSYADKFRDAAWAFLRALCQAPNGESLLKEYGTFIERKTAPDTEYAEAWERGHRHVTSDASTTLQWQSSPQKTYSHELRSTSDAIRKYLKADADRQLRQGRLAHDIEIIAARLEPEVRSLLQQQKAQIDKVLQALIGNGESADSDEWRDTLRSVWSTVHNLASDKEKAEIGKRLRALDDVKESTEGDTVQDRAEEVRWLGHEIKRIIERVTDLEPGTVSRLQQEKARLEEGVQALADSGEGARSDEWWGLLKKLWSIARHVAPDEEAALIEQELKACEDAGEGLGEDAIRDLQDWRAMARNLASDGENCQADGCRQLLSMHTDEMKGLFETHTAPKIIDKIKKAAEFLVDRITAETTTTDVPEPEIPPEDSESCRTLVGIAEYAEREFGHRPSERSIQNWKDDGSLRIKKRGALWDFSKSDLEKLVGRPKNGK